jgi:hypothetical protein
VVGIDIPSKVSKVRDYVKSVMDVIESSKEKQIIEEERKADMSSDVSYAAKQVDHDDSE